MRVDEKLLRDARRSPDAFRFADAVRLAAQLGFRKVRQAGRHRVYRAPPGRDPGLRQPLNLQEGPDGNAKAHQVEHMLALASALGILRGGR